MSAHLPRLAGSALVALFLWLAPVVAVAARRHLRNGAFADHRTGGKVHKFTVELAVDNDQRSQGLMNRRHMARDHGMLFDFGVTRQVMMWMKNTYLPLDMLFIAKDGKIETIRKMPSSVRSHHRFTRCRCISSSN
jgi:uncharacterized membrane protein (UPF0127 family)